MRAFEYHAPKNLEEVHQLLKTYGEEARVVAGGTSLVLMMKERLISPGHVISLRGVPGLDGIRLTDGELSLGALCTHRQVETSSVVKEYVPLLAETYRHVATVRIRHMATVGGGLAYGEPNQDPPPSLLVLEARVHLTSAQGQRVVPLDQFFVDYLETVIKPEEVLTQVTVPLTPPGTGTAFFKFLPRTADDYATVAVAALVTLEEDGTCREARIALGAAGPVPLRARETEAILRGRRITPELLREAEDMVKKEVDPMSDIRGSAEYKREMAGVFTRRALEQALARAGVRA